MRWSHVRYVLGLLKTALSFRLHHLIPAHQIPSRFARVALWFTRLLLPAAKSLEDQLPKALESRGPVFIKLGQLLSTRPDVLGETTCQALAKLQDQVRPMAGEEAIGLIKEALGEEALAQFHDIAPKPLASASIAQVHAAQLISGEDVVIKVVRPGIETLINTEMSALIELARWLEGRFPLLGQLHLAQIFSDQQQVMLTELNMFLEARNQIQLRRNFADSPLLHVPRLYSSFTRFNLLVMTRMYAPSIGDLHLLKDAGVDLKVLAHKGVETFFTQVFEHNFFHADMHPGNVFVDIQDPADPKWIALDCAIIGSLSESDQSYLAQNLIAFFARDYRQIVNLHLRSGWIPATTDVEAFEEVIASVCEPIFAQPLSEISFAAFMTDLLEAARAFNMQVQPQLVLLQKTLLYIEGLGRQLYPQLDLWETAAPFMQRWAVRNLGAVAILGKLLDQGPKILSELHRLPSLLDDTQTIDLRIQLAQQQDQLEQLSIQLSKSRRQSRRRWALSVSLLAAGAAWLLCAGLW
ncbi:MAG: AarF/UbiB family protein [Gammaproteobacteria bacterium]